MKLFFELHTKMLRQYSLQLCEFLPKRHADFAIKTRGLHYETDKQVLTMQEARTKMMQRTGIEEGFLPEYKSREHLNKYLPKIEDLPPRSMRDSYSKVIIPLSKDKLLQGRYASIMGHVRIGRLLEDVDSFGVWTCHQHVILPKLPKDVYLPYTFVTISLDNVAFTDFEAVIHKDIELSGHVIWVGKTSIKIRINLRQCVDGVCKELTTAHILFAARNATNTGPNLVNPLQLCNDEERKIFATAAEQINKAKANKTASIFIVDYCHEEMQILNSLFLKTINPKTLSLNEQALPKNSKWMSDSSAVNTISGFPEFRNSQNTIFGGYLMRIALEISWLSAFMYCESRARLMHISQISFHKPVPVGSFLQTSSYVAYTENNHMQMRTTANVIDPKNGGQITTNVFHFTYVANDKVAQIIPRTYHETLWFAKGRRMYKDALAMHKCLIDFKCGKK